MYSIEEQYKTQYKEIKRHYRKKKITISAISFIIAIITGIITYLGYKEIINIKNYWIYTTIFTAGALTLAIKLPFNQSDSEYNEIKELNNTYIHERFKERNG